MYDDQWRITVKYVAAMTTEGKFKKRVHRDGPFLSKLERKESVPLFENEV